MSELHYNEPAEKSKRGRPRKEPEARHQHGWLELIDAVKAESRLITRIWHPEATVALHDLGHGVNAQVLVGDPAYQVTTGEIVSL